MFAILFLVTFGFLILTTPGYICMLYIMVVDFFATPKLFAGYHFFYSFCFKVTYDESWNKLFPLRYIRP